MQRRRVQADEGQAGDILLRHIVAYCLLGIFGVFMPLIYGEGKAHAVHRPKKEIAEAANRNDTPGRRWNPCLQTFKGHSGYVLSVAYSPDGARRIGIGR